MDPIIKFRQLLCNTINDNDLPFSMKYFVFKDIYNEMQQMYEQFVIAQNKAAIEISEPEAHKKKIECEIEEETNKILSYKESEEDTE